MCEIDLDQCDDSTSWKSKQGNMSLWAKVRQSDVFGLRLISSTIVLAERA